MDIKVYLSTKLSTVIASVFKLKYEVDVTIPQLIEHGDYSTNIAMTLSKELKRSPIDIATELKPHLEQIDFVEKVEIVNPGFTNIFINEKFLVSSILSKVVKDNIIEPLGKVIVEHTSVNPNKAMHVGHLRNAILGDSIARLLRRVGYEVEVQNYIDDTGLQVADTTNAVLNLGIPYSETSQDFDDYCWDIYSKINVEYENPDSELLVKRKMISKEIEEGVGETSDISKGIVEKLVNAHVSQLLGLGIQYDLLVYESSVVRSNLWEIVFKELKSSPNFILETEGKNAGCWVLKNNGDGGDKVYVRSDGTKVYTAKDTAYHFWKFGLVDFDFQYKKFQSTDIKYDLWKTSTEVRDAPNIKFGGADKTVNIIDERQSYPQEMVKKSLELLGHKKQAENFIHVAYAVVTLSQSTAKSLGVDVSDDSQNYAMSGRKGIGVKAKDLVKLVQNNIATEKMEGKPQDAETLNKIATAAIRLYMLKNHSETPVVFDYENALSIEGFTGPYLQYSYARAKSILRKGKLGTVGITEYSHKLDANEIELIKTIGNWPTVLNGTAESLNISFIAEYAFKLAGAFNSFYHSSPVLSESEDVKNFRLSLVNIFSNVLADALEILGIETHEEM